MDGFKVLIADAHTLTRQGIKALLARRKGICIAGEVKNSGELSEQIVKIGPDILIIDFDLPGHFSIRDVAFVSNNFPRIGILVISTNQHKQDILKVIDWGVKGYLLKECDEKEIIEAVYAVARKERFFCGKVMDVILAKAIHQDGFANAKQNSCEAVSLSDREVEIVKLIAQGYTTKSIAEKLYLSFHTITTHRKNIFKKLNVRSSSELVLYAIRQGIISA